jgi:hypothetical protein
MVQEPGRSFQEPTRPSTHHPKHHPQRSTTTTLSLLHRFTPLLNLNPLHKIINHTRPTTLLAPEPQTLILLRLDHKRQRLAPQIAVHRLLPLALQELQPQWQKIQPAGRNPRKPRLLVRQYLPEIDRRLEIDGFFGCFDENAKGVVVDCFVLLERAVGREQLAEDVLFDFVERVAVCVEEGA